MGSHSFKVGADIRRLGVALATASECPNGTPALGGCFQFNPCSPAGTASAATKWRASCSALPYAGSVPSRSGHFEWYAKNYGAYFQDDWRVNSKFTLNYGLRLEHEDGLREINNRQTVAFDRERDQSDRRARAEDRSCSRARR